MWKSHTDFDETMTGANQIHVRGEKKLIPYFLMQKFSLWLKGKEACGIFFKNRNWLDEVNEIHKRYYFQESQHSGNKEELSAILFINSYLEFKIFSKHKHIPIDLFSESFTKIIYQQWEIDNKSQSYLNVVFQARIFHR